MVFSEKHFNEKRTKDLATKKMQFYRTALEDSELNSTAVRILGLLLLKYYNNKIGQCNPSEKTLAADVKKDQSTVRRSISQLEADGYITIQHGTNIHGCNKSNQYQFQWVPLKNEQCSKMSRVPLKNAQDTAHFCTRIPLKNEHLTTEGTTEGTNQKNTHAECGFLDKKGRSQMQDSNLKGKEGSHGQFNSSLKASLCPSPSARDGTNFSDKEPSNLSPDDSNLSDEDENPFAHLADGKDDFPSHQKNNFSSQQPNNFPSQQENNCSSRPYEYEFSEFWRIFPPEKKYNQKGAYKAFVDAVKNKGVDARMLAITANKYKWFCRQNYHQSNHKRYISQPDSWLLNERWKDISRQVNMSNDSERPFIADERPSPVPPNQQLSLESCGLSQEDLNSIQEEAINKLRSRNTDMGSEQLFDDEEDKWAM